MFGYEEDSLPGVLLSLEILGEVSKMEEARSKTNKGKSSDRKGRAKAAVRKPKK